MLDWLGTRVGVYGYGKTGRAAVAFLAPRLIRPLVFVDETDPARLAALQTEAGESCEILGPALIPAAVETLDSLILSPGVPLSNPNVQRAKQRGALVISELELAARYCPGHILAVTGTNGKSTTTKLLGHILSAVGPTHVLGNIGSPLLGSLDEIAPGDFVALEVSSFQLEAVERFAPRVAIYTNLTPDHLDRHGTLEEYARVKRSMTARMGAGDFVVTNANAPEFAPARFENQQPVFLQYDAGSSRTTLNMGSGADLQVRREEREIRPEVEDFHRYYRRLPHWRKTGSTYWLTWRVHESRAELSEWARDQVQSALHHFDSQRYDLVGYVVMNDHVHVVVTPLPGCELQVIVKSWKAFTAAQVNKLEGKSGPLWEQEYMDRIIRSEEELFEKLQYMEENPRKRWPELTSYKWYYCLLRDDPLGWRATPGGPEGPPHYINSTNLPEGSGAAAGSGAGLQVRGAWIAGDTIHVNLGVDRYELPLSCIKLPGIHNRENALAALTAALLMGASPSVVEQQLSSFTGYEHRLELVRTAGGVAFYNDSKATNPEATITALKAFSSGAGLQTRGVDDGPEGPPHYLKVRPTESSSPLSLILGGRDKLTDLSELAEWVKRVATHTVLIGEAAERFETALRAAGYGALTRAPGLKEAVPICIDALHGSGTVLLSPACASFDQYDSYEQRGEHFKQIVAALEL